MWIFGYGSLIWKPGFSYLEKRPGYIKGWKRRFYQGSYDHRGVPGSPGRVATLLADNQCWTWGMAYEVSPAVREEILEKLDHREKGGYERYFLSVYQEPTNLEPINQEPDSEEKAPLIVVEEALVYMATPGNPHYLGPASEREIAMQVLGAEGPSGTNREYVERLALALKDAGIVDPHLFEIYEHLLSLAVSS